MLSSRRVRGLLACGALGIVGGVSMVMAQTPAAKPAPAATGPGSVEDYNRPVAFIYGNVPVTRQMLGEFVIARGGIDKLDLLINRTIIETEAKRLGLSVTDSEMEAAFMSDLEGLGEGGIKRSDFIRVVLPKYGKTLYEWMEDVIRPRLLLTKMVAGNIKVEEKEIDIQFEREFGEKRDVQIILWPKGDDEKGIQATYAKIRGNQDEFDAAARQMANPSLASSLGRIKPIARHSIAHEPIVEQVAFQLKVGELSHVINTSQGYLVIKLRGIIPAQTNVDRKSMRDRLAKQAFDEKVSAAIPEHFAALKKQADPKIFADLKGGKWSSETAVEEMKPMVMPGK
ncbi:MAG: peptidylprolyl isomerase [Fimbriiglobus sp.]